MHSFSADPANSHCTTRIYPALTSFADEIRGTLARLSAYVMALALFAILGTALCGALPGAMVTDPSTKGGWSQVARPAWAFAVGQANLHDKTEAYEMFRHPEGGAARDILRWPAQLWQHPAKTLVFMKLFWFAPHYSGAVWRN